MVRRIVDAACAVLDVSISALAVIDPDDVTESFVHSGLDDDRATVQSIIDAPEHLSVRIDAGGRPFADLYVTGSLYGPFDECDLELLTALARSAGSAIAHARQFARATRSTSWLHAAGEIARAMLADADIDMFGEIVDRAIAAAGADYGQLLLPYGHDRLEVIATSGHGCDDMIGQTFDYEISDIGRAVANGKTLRAPDIMPLANEDFDNVHDLGPVMIVPLLDAIGTRGSVIVCRRRGQLPFSEDDLNLFATYASQVALAMQFADSRADAERMQVLETRHNIARELHDVVMQRLFATGMGLQTLTTQVADKVHSTLLARYVSDLDETIDEIRDRVFGLEGDATSADPRETIFPRIELDAATAATDAGTSAPPVKRGRRRSDWSDGTGARRA